MVLLYVAKATIVLRCAVISCMVTAQMICAFVLAYLKRSHDAAHTFGTELLKSQSYSETPFSKLDCINHIMSPLHQIY